MTTYFTAKELLTPPSERAAFSDRQAYVCAELSRLAYLKFEGGHTLDQVLTLARTYIPDDSSYKILEQKLRGILANAANTAAASEQALRDILKGSGNGFELIKTFSEGGTQAFLCTKTIKTETGTDKILAYLAFRGTEPDRFEDIKTDIKAKLAGIQLDGEEVFFHSGFLEALQKIEPDEDSPTKLSKILENTKYDQLFITGHSLGGALAILATRILANSVNGACYTYGAPPVGDFSVQNRLKTPVYEIINQTDIVPRLPNPWMVGMFRVLLKALRLVAKLFTLLERLLASGTWDEKLEKYVESMTAYRHPGYRSYLVGTAKEARLRFNVNSFDLLWWWLTLMWKRKIWMFKTMVGDHSIDVYVDKLKQHALKRV